MEYPLYAEKLNHYLSLLTIVGGVSVIIFAAYVVYVAYSTNKQNSLILLVSTYVLQLSYVTALVGVTMSLFYSEVVHYVPCDLCWYQRIFLYPQVFLFAYAWYKKDRNVLPYAIVLSVVGFIIAAYHHMLQIGFDLMKPCSSALFAVDCAKPTFIEYGFVTFPLMSAVLFGTLLVIAFVGVKFKK